MAINCTVNGKKVSFHLPPETPLLWAVRDTLNLTGSKYGCGIAQCGACTMMVNGTPTRTCVMPLSAIKNAKIETIEGVSGPVKDKVVKAWDELQVFQCGYCQSGQIISAIGLLEHNPKPTDTDIDKYMSGNICRCATYVRIRKAIKKAAEELA